MEDRRGTPRANGRSAGTRTQGLLPPKNRLLTKQLLCPLSYASTRPVCPGVKRLSALPVSRICSVAFGAPPAHTLSTHERSCQRMGRRKFPEKKLQTISGRGNSHIPKPFPMVFRRHTLSGLWGEFSRHSSRPPLGRTRTGIRAQIMGRSSNRTESAWLRYREEKV